MSSLIGCHARDPRMLPIDVEWYDMPDKRIDHIWNIVKESYIFPEGSEEPYKWFCEKLGNMWRWNKCTLKRTFVDGKTKETALSSKPPRIPERQRKNFVEFALSDEMKERSESIKENVSKYTMRHHAGTKSLARIRHEETKDGVEPNELHIFEITHKPALGSVLDPETIHTLDEIDMKLKEIPDEVDAEERCSKRKKVFEDIVGQDKNGYAKTYGIGVKVPRSGKKRCALIEERERRMEMEETMNAKLKTALEEIRDLHAQQKIKDKKIDVLETTVLEVIGQDEVVYEESDKSEEDV